MHPIHIGLRVKDLEKAKKLYAAILAPLDKVASWLDVFGSERGGMLVSVTGTDPQGGRKRLEQFEPEFARWGMKTMIAEHEA